MKNLLFPFVVFLLLAATSASAQETKPINVALFEPVQIFKKDVSITGVRLNVLYGRNADMKGLDIGIANWTTGEFAGIGWGWILNFAEGDATGWQTAAINITEGDLAGLQTGLYNGVGGGQGVMLGWVNVSDSFEGLQLSLVNYTKDYHGIQIGLVNIITSKQTLSFFPIVNWKFD